MDGGQGRGTGGVDGHTGPSDPQDIGDAPSRRARRIAGGQVKIVLFLATEAQVAAHAAADEDAHFLVEDRFRHNIRIFQRVPGRFQEQAVGWIHHRDFTGRKAKERGVKLVDAVEKAATQRVRGRIVRCRSTCLGCCQGDQLTDRSPIHILDARCRQFVNPVKTGQQLFPELLGGIERDTSRPWKATAHAHNRDRLVIGGQSQLLFLHQFGRLV